ncbi:MAG: TetR/AcrR family transcriptional regulator [Promethearchaeota archaeon]
MVEKSSKMSETSVKRRTRCRSPEKKAAQFEEILEAGKKLFEERGRDGFSLRALAKSLGMNQNNLYNYVESKRELYIAIRNKYFKQYREENLDIINDHKSSSFELLMKLFNHFLKFAERDFGAFRMMHLRQSPPSDKIGPIEKEYREFRLLTGTNKLIRKTIQEGDIINTNDEMLTFFVYSVVLGAAMIERHMREMLKISMKGDFASELIQFGDTNFSTEEFRNFVLENLEFILREKT